MLVKAAVKILVTETNQELIVTDVRHGDCFYQISQMGFKPRQGYKELAQGFVTDTGVFLDRYEAKKHAIACGQIVNLEYAELYSEDVW